MSDQREKEAPTSEKATVTLPGTVEKVIPSLVPDEPEKAQISVQGADDLYKEIRIENTLESESGEPVKLKPGAQVEVTIEADEHAVKPKSNNGGGSDKSSESAA